MPPPPNLHQMDPREEVLIDRVALNQWQCPYNRGGHRHRGEEGGRENWRRGEREGVLEAGEKGGHRAETGAWLSGPVLWAESRPPPLLAPLGGAASGTRPCPGWGLSSLLARSSLGAETAAVTAAPPPPLLEGGSRREALGGTGPAALSAVSPELHQGQVPLTSGCL